MRYSTQTRKDYGTFTMLDITDVENETNISVAGSLDVALIFIHSQLEKSLGNTELACRYGRYTG